jgi:hypothetical protein
MRLTTLVLSSAILEGYLVFHAMERISDYGGLLDGDVFAMVS